MLRFGSGTSSEGWTRIAVPIPEQVGHAPAGSLNVNCNCCISRLPDDGACSQTFVEPLHYGVVRFSSDDVKAEQAIAKLESMLQRSDDLLIDSRSDHERVDDRFNRVLLIFTQFNVLAKVARLAVDSARR
jgi:hypothetical protein